MKVTFCFAESADPCNAQAIWLRRLLPCLRPRAVDVTALVLAVDLPRMCGTLQNLQAEGIRCRVTQSLGSTGNMVRWFLKQVAASPPDVFIPHHMPFALYAARWVREAGIPTVCVLHNDDKPTMGLIEQFGNRNPEFDVSAFVAVSQQIADRARATSCEGAWVETIPCGVPVPAFSASYHPDVFRLCFVGRLIERQKRVTEVARGLCLAVEAVPGVEASIWGTGAAHESVRRVLSESGLEERVRLEGPIENKDVQAKMSGCQAIVLLSDYEGTPTVLMEAMACGVVPICTKIGGGVEELIEDGVTGLLVNDRGDDFVQAVRYLRADPERWRRLSRQARARVEERFSVDVCADKWVEFLTRLHDRAGRQRRVRVPFRLDLPAPHPWLKQERRVPLWMDAPIRIGLSARRLWRRLRRGHLEEPTRNAKPGQTS